LGIKIDAFNHGGTPGFAAISRPIPPLNDPRRLIPRTLT
jgi:hypothetical protein